MGRVGTGWLAAGGEESLLGLVVVVAVIVVQLVKGIRQFRRNRPGQTPAPGRPASAGPDEELRKFLESLARPAPEPAPAPSPPETSLPRPPRRAEAPTPEASPRAVPQTQAAVPRPPSSQRVLRDSAVTSATVRRDALAAPSPDEDQGRARLPSLRAVSRAAEEPHPAPEAGRRRQAVLAMLRDRSALKNAVLARVILGPPVALR